MRFGLSSPDLQVIQSKIAALEEIEHAMLFGSRAKGNYKAGSDIDIAIFGDAVDMNVVARLHSLLEDSSSMPYFFDIVDGTHLEHAELKQHIERVGQVIYTKVAGNKFQDSETNLPQA